MKQKFGIQEYAIPLVAEDEILIEKTAEYTRGNMSVLMERAMAMKLKIPNLKLIVILCDPVKRIFSQISHHGKVSQQKLSNHYIELVTHVG